jgi:hypothetical protein
MTAIRGEVSIEETTVRELEETLRNRLVRPGGPTYEEQRRVWNGSIKSL